MSARPKVTVSDGRGGVLVESTRAAARFFVQERHDGGLYVEVVMERGEEITTGKTSQSSPSVHCEVAAARRETDRP